MNGMNNNSILKKRYSKPELVAVAIDQEIALIMMTPGEFPGLDEEPASPASSQIFGPSNVGETTINWEQYSRD